MGVAFMSISKCRSMESPNTIVNDYDKYSYSHNEMTLTSRPLIAPTFVAHLWSHYIQKCLLWPALALVNNIFDIKNKEYIH